MVTYLVGSCPRTALGDLAGLVSIPALTDLSPESTDGEEKMFLSEQKSFFFKWKYVLRELISSFGLV